MALRFSPAPFDERRQAPDLSASFDAFMNAYARSKQLGMAEQQAQNQQTTFDQAQADRAIQNQMTWGTANPTPEYVSAANRAAQPDFQGPILPSMQVALENIKRQREMRDLESRGVKAKIGSEEASAFKDTALGVRALREPVYGEQSKGLKPPAGYRFLSDGTLEPIPGGPAEEKVGKAKQAEAIKRQTAASNAKNTLNAIDSALARINKYTTGIGGALLSKLPATEAKSLANDLQTVKSNVALNSLMELKSASPNGASGFGALSEKELAVITDRIAKLDQNADPEYLRNALRETRDLYSKTVSDIFPSNDGGKIRVSNGRETLEIDPSDLNSALKDGYRRL